MTRAGATLAVLTSWLAIGIAPTLAATAETPARAARTEGAPAWTAAAENPPDSTLGQFLESLSDSTDRYFGRTAAPLDTAGLDSALDYGLAHPRELAQRRHERISYVPGFAFNRVDGPVWSTKLILGRAGARGELSGRLAYAVGPNRWLGGGTYRRLLTSRAGVWALTLSGGRSTALMDRTTMDTRDDAAVLTTAYALIGGADTRRYLRRDGVELGLERSSEWLVLGAGFRDMLETPLETTATWTLTGSDPQVPGNLAAAPGRAREGRFEAALRWPRLPVYSEIVHETAGRAVGSDFTYRRTRASIGADLGLSRWAALVPQATYGRLSGQPVPQQAFYLGGASSLRSLEGAERGGTRLALGRVDLLGSSDLLALAHIPHPAAFPLQAGAFAAAGAVWGVNPYGGGAVPGGSWPHRQDWLTEAGVSLIYQPGIPDPLRLVRLNLAWPLGPGSTGMRMSLTYSRALDLLRPFED